MDRAVVLVPRREGKADRDALWAFARGWWADHVGLPIIEGHHDAAEGPFNRALAINRAALLAEPWNVAVVIDADVLLDPGQVHSAVGCARRTGHLVVGFTERLHLNGGGTAKVIAGYDGNWRPYARIVAMESVSSCVAVRRDLWDQVGGFDPAFVGWGYEDVAFRVHCEAIDAHPVVRIGGPMWHLHHQVSGGNNRDEPTFTANEARGAAYKEAMWDPEAMRRVRQTPNSLCAVAAVAGLHDPDPLGASLGGVRLAR